jgi:hypothetical protein
MRRAVAGVIAAGGWAAVVWVLWAPILRRLGDLSVNDVLKDYYLSDQFAYMAVAKNVEDGAGLFVEPYTTTGSSIAPSAYYWLLGTTARAADLSIFGAWNVLGIAVAVLLLAMATAWCVWARPGGLAWCAAPFALLSGTLLWWTTDGNWVAQYGDHAVLWAPTSALYSPGAEGPGLLLGGLTLLALVASLAARGRRALILAGVAGLLLGLVLETQTYIAIFMAVALVFTACVHEALTRPGRWWTASLVAAVTALLVVLAFTSSPGAVGRLILLLAVCVAWLVARPAWLRATWRHAVALVAGAAVTGSVLIVRIIGQALDPDSFFYVRQELATTRHLALPADQVLLQFLPTWLLAILAIAFVSRRVADPRRRPWLAALIGLTAAGALLVFNESWNFHTEPYRFLPYVTVLLPVAAVPALYGAIVDGGWAWRGAGAAVVAAAVFTIPTTLAFVDATRDQVFVPAAQEREAYRDIMARTDDQLTAFDSCFRPELVKVLAGGSVLAMNRGLAIPPNYRQTRRVLVRFAAGKLTRTAVLRKVGVRWIVSTNHCDGIPTATLRERFGVPIRIALRDASLVGAPADLTYEVYRVGAA